MQSMNKNTITNVMIVGGSLYLVQLAKQYSENDPTSYPILFNSILVIEYLILLRINYMNAHSQIAKMQKMIDSEDLIPRAFVPGLTLKIHQIKVYIVCMVCFYASRVFYNTYITVDVYII